MLNPKRTAAKRSKKRGRRGDGSIVKLPTGRFQAIHSVGTDPATVLAGSYDPVGVLRA